MPIPTQTLPRFVRQMELSLTDNESQDGSKKNSEELADLLTSIALGVKMIGQLVSTAGFRGLQGYSGKTNVQGEQTFKLDDEADEILVQLLGSSGHFGSLVSEERDGAIETDVVRKGAKYVVAFDPLDGSSNIGSNIPVGTIFTIFHVSDLDKGASVNDFLQKGKNIAAAGYSVYGAKTSFVYSAGRGVHGFTLDPTLGEFILTEESLKFPTAGNTYSVNEGYWSNWTPELQNFILALKTGENSANRAYSGRYVGSLVADFDRNLRKGGLFLHPANAKRERGKLRLLYECIPLAYIAEQAGGVAIDGEQEVLEILPKDIHERCPFIVGGVDDIALYKEMCL